MPKINRERTFNKKVILISELEFECNLNEPYTDAFVDITLDGLLMYLDDLNDNDFINYLNDYNVTCYKVYSNNDQLMYYAIEIII